MPWADALETAAAARPLDLIARADVEAALAGFRGRFRQNPPPFSAKRVGGTPGLRRSPGAGRPSRPRP